MKISTADFPNEVSRYELSIEVIAQHVEDHKPDLLVQQEIPFTPWFFFTPMPLINP